MILRLHHHEDIWHEWELKAGAVSWEPDPRGVANTRALFAYVGFFACLLWVFGFVFVCFCIAVRCSPRFPSQPQKLPLPV